MVIGFIGNFIPQYSTENDRMWTLQKMGHDVLAFQENKTTPEVLLEYAPKMDMLLYSHTHDPEYAIPDLINVFKEYKKMGIPTVSIHLDKWAGLERVVDVGKEATWFTEYIFMADACEEAKKLYDSLNLNWFYLPAAVVERDCYMAQSDPVRFPHEIIFVGSYGYHKEYGFRNELIDFLKKEYGDRFGHYGNDGLGVIRGHDLNVLYASSKIAVGDSCFGGQDNYVSDRYYETRGRGGLLLHPHVEGVDRVGVVPYEKYNLGSVKNTIDFLLKNPDIAEGNRKAGFTHTKHFETYTQRMTEMFRVIEENAKRKDK